MKPSADDFRDWQSNPVTKFVFEEIDLMINDYCQAMGSGAVYSASSVEKTALKTAETIGFIDGLRSLSKIELRD